MTPEDEKIIQQFHQSATQKIAFEQIVRKYSRPLFAHIGKYVNHREDIEDVLQIVWVKAWKGLQNFRGESMLSTWLFTIATREAYNFYRSRKPISVELGETEIQYSVGKSDLTIDANEIIAKLHSAMDILPDKQKQVFVMRYFEELSYDDMSRKTGTSVGALKASYHHAVKKIEEFINPH